MPSFNALTNDQLTTRFQSHKVNTHQADAMQVVRDALNLAASTLRDVCPVSPELSRAYNKMEEASFLGVAAIARRTKSDEQARADLNS